MTWSDWNSPNPRRHTGTDKWRYAAKHWTALSLSKNALKWRRHRHKIEEIPFFFSFPWFYSFLHHHQRCSEVSSVNGWVKEGEGKVTSKQTIWQLPPLLVLPSLGSSPAFYVERRKLFLHIFSDHIRMGLVGQLCSSCLELIHLRASTTLLVYSPNLFLSHVCHSLQLFSNMEFYSAYHPSCYPSNENCLSIDILVCFLQHSQPRDGIRWNPTKYVLPRIHRLVYLACECFYLYIHEDSPALN